MIRESLLDEYVELIDGKLSDEKKIKLFLNLKDNEKSHLESYGYLPSVIYRSIRYKKDLKSRENRRKAQIRKNFMAKLKESFTPPADEKILWELFLDWCGSAGINLKKQTMNGRNFKKFRRELDNEFSKAYTRAELLADVFIVEAPMPVSFESSWDFWFADSWNSTLIESAKTGKIPEKQRANNTRPHDQCLREGCNQAIAELKKPKYKKIFG